MAIDVLFLSVEASGLLNNNMRQIPTLVCAVILFCVSITHGQVATTRTNPLDIRAVALSSDTVKVSYEVNSNEDVTEVRVSYSVDDGNIWRDIDVDPEKQSTILKGLQAQTHYSFRAAAFVGVESIITVKNVTTLKKVPRMSSFYATPSEAALIQITLRDAVSAAFEYPGRPHMKEAGKARYIASPKNPDEGILIIADVEYKDAGFIRYSNARGDAEVELVVYEPGKVQGVKVEAVSGDKISVSWRRPLEYPELVKDYVVIVFQQPSGSAIIYDTKRDLAENGLELSAILAVPPGEYLIRVAARYAFQQDQKKNGPYYDTNIGAELWTRILPRLTIQAQALGPDSVQVSYGVVNTEDLDRLQLSYSDDQGSTWTDVEVDPEKQSVTVEGLKAETTYSFKAKAVLAGDEKEAIKDVKTLPPAHESYSLDVLAARESPKRFRVIWFVSQGEVRDVEGFRLTITDKDGKELFSKKLAKRHRAALLRRVSSDSFTFVVEAYDAQGKVLASRVVEVGQPSEGDPELLVEVNEFQSRRARLGWILKNYDHRKLDKVRMSVYKNGPSGEKSFTKILSPSRTTIVLTKMTPNRTFFILMEALGKDGTPFVRSALTLKTPPAGEAGQRVIGAPYKLL